MQGVHLSPWSIIEQTRLTLTFDPDPQDPADESAASDDAPPGQDVPPPGGDQEDLGVGEAIGGVRGAFMRMLEAHIALLKAELSVAGKQLGIIIGLAAGALTLALLTLILLYVGTFLFMGDWLFGSMGWGIIHGTLLAGALIGIIAVNLAGGQIGAYLWGVVWGVLVAVLLSLLLISNLLREAAVAGAEAVENDIPLHPHLLPTVVGFVVGAAILAVAALIAGWRSDWKYGSPLVMTMIGIGLGGFVGMLFASTVYDNPNGVVGLGIMVGLIVWISVGAWLASRRGFDPEARYESLVPRESMASFETTRTFMEQQMERQKKRFMGR
jgi:hypothetical protein